MAMRVIEAADDLGDNTDKEPELEQMMKFSTQVAWVVAKPSKNGHILKIICSNREEVWLSHDIHSEKGDFSNKIFDGEYNHDVTRCTKVQQ